MIRYFDTFLRYIWVWFVPIIVFPIIVTIFLTSSSTYTAKATLWVEQPLFGDQQAKNTQWDSPAKQMAGLLSELLNTQEFVNSVIVSTSRKQTIKTQQDQLNAIDYIATKTKIAGDTTRLITISFPDSKATSAVETLEAIISRFQEYYNGRVKSQGESASTYYQQLVDSSKADLDKATEELKTFIQDHPNQLSRDGAVRATSPEDLEYTRLSQNLSDARQSYDAAKSNLDKVMVSYGAYQQGQATTIRVIDKPSLGDTGSSKLRTTILGVVAGVVIGLVCAIIGTVLLTILDGALRYSFHASSVLGRERIVELPNYSLSPKIKKQVANGAEPKLDDFKKGKYKTSSSGKRPSGKKSNQSISLRKVLSARIKLPANE